jgi:hypothetical protein
VAKRGVRFTRRERRHKAKIIRCLSARTETGQPDRDSLLFQQTGALGGADGAGMKGDVGGHRTVERTKPF